jgi:hypothetical protein
MNKVFFSVGLSLDGYLAGPNRGPKNPIGDGGSEIHQWAFKQKAFLQRLNLEGGDTGNKDNDIIQEIFDRTGANIMGRPLFDNIEKGKFSLEIMEAIHSPLVTHLKYKVISS